ncbi:MAG: glycosyltransferase [Cetobacterium sp.]
MKIAIINHNLGSGGAEKLIYDMALELQVKKIDFSIILLTSIGDIYGKKLIKEGIDVKFLSAKNDVYSPKNIYRLIKILQKYDIVHVHTYLSQLWVAFASIFLSKLKKYILTEHSTNNRRRDKKYFRILDRWMYSKYSIIVSISDKVQEELQKWIKINSNYKVIKNGINIEKYLNAVPKKRSEFNLKDEDKLICQVARFIPLKNQETTVEALRLLPKNYKIIFLGEGEKKEKIKSLAHKYELEERVKFLGYRSDVPEIIKMCDISVLTSEYEGLPISAIEAMFLNPFIGSDVSGIKDLVKEKELLFKYQDNKELSKLIKKILEDKNYYQRVKEVCFNNVKCFDIALTTENYIKQYTNLIDKKGHNL